MAEAIGQINGMWARLFKMTLAAMPFLIVWLSWITVGQILDNQFRSKGSRLTGEQFNHRMDAFHTRVTAEQANAHMQALQPVTDSVTTLGGRVTANEKSIDMLNRDMSSVLRKLDDLLVVTTETRTKIGTLLNDKWPDKGETQ